MWNVPSNERLTQIPKLYDTEHIQLKDKLIHLHFFVGNCDWWICEFDASDLFWGFCSLGDDQNAEWGYVSFTELKSLKVHGWLEIDCETDQFWKVRPASEISRICKCNGWPNPKSAAA